MGPVSWAKGSSRDAGRVRLQREASQLFPLRGAILQGGVLAVCRLGAGLQIWLLSFGLFCRFLGLARHLGALAGVTSHLSWTQRASVPGCSEVRRVCVADPQGSRVK